MNRYIVVKSAAPNGPVIKLSNTVNSFKIVVKGLFPAAAGGGGVADGSITDIKVAANANITLSKIAGGSALATRNYVDQKTAYYYQHIQGVPSASWVIPHNLGKLYPFITVISSAGDELEGGYVVPIDTNNLIINFSSGFGGIAYLQ